MCAAVNARSIKWICCCVVVKLPVPCFEDCRGDTALKVSHWVCGELLEVKPGGLATVGDDVPTGVDMDALGLEFLQGNFAGGNDCKGIGGCNVGLGDCIVQADDVREVLCQGGHVACPHFVWWREDMHAA